MSHLQFFYYEMFMCVPTVKEAYAIQNILKYFIDASTTLIIMIKSKIFFFKVHFSVQNNLSRILSFLGDYFTTKYLGLPYQTLPNAPNVVLIFWLIWRKKWIDGHFDLSICRGTLFLLTSSLKISNLSSLYFCDYY